MELKNLKGRLYNKDREIEAKMIKLTLNPDTEAKTYTLDQDVIVIGNGSNEHADIPLSQKSIKDIHVKIIEENDRFLAVNSANDPFTSLNSLPFGKKTLKNFDIIEIDQIKIKFEFIDENAPPPPLPVQEALDIDSLLQEVESFSSTPNEPEPAETIEEKEDEKPAPAEIENKDSLEITEPEPSANEEPQPSEEPKKYYLRDFDDESEQWSDESGVEETYEQKGNIGDSWKVIATLLFAIITLSTVICSGVYFRASGKNSQEEKKIGAGIGDIAMAMTHARLNRITPDEQNWSNPDFIRNNLSIVLSPKLHTQAQIDSEGRFTRYPYRLRVYTSSNSDRFVVIAQPAPNVMQWLIHKKTIVIDSNSMEMRKITDLKALNRLLANPNPLEGANGDEISRVLREGELMSLNSLAGHKNHWGYSPPKALGFIRPGAENYIYNAPRYYPFGEALLRKAVDLYLNPGNSSDVSILQDEMDMISNFPDVVLYTSQGLQMAIEAQKALNTFVPNSNFLVAYVKFNTDGFVASSHLLMNEERNEIAFLSSPKHQISSLLGNDKEEEVDLLSLNFDEKEQQPAESNHPLFLRLDALYSDRKRALKSISMEMVELLNQQNTDLHPYFQDSFNTQLNLYIKTDLQHRKKIIQSLGSLYQEYTEMPLKEFIQFIDQANLTSFAHESLNRQKNTLGNKTLTQEEIQKRYNRIQNADSLRELENEVEQTAHVLSLENLPEPEKLIVYQDIMHNHVLEKLTQLLLSPDSLPSTVEVNEENRSALIHILENSWISDSYESEYFLHEFDLLEKTH